MNEDGEQLNLQDLLSGSDLKEPPLGPHNTEMTLKQQSNTTEKVELKKYNEFSDVIETRRTCNTQAYMLVYIRESMRQQIL